VTLRGVFEIETVSKGGPRKPPKII